MGTESASISVMPDDMSEPEYDSIDMHTMLEDPYEFFDEPSLQLLQNQPAESDIAHESSATNPIPTTNSSWQQTLYLHQHQVIDTILPAAIAHPRKKEK